MEWWKNIYTPNTTDVNGVHNWHILLKSKSAQVTSCWNCQKKTCTIKQSVYVLLLFHVVNISRQMHEIIKEIVVCVLYLFLILLLAYTNRDLSSYRMHTNYNNIFNKGNFEGAMQGTKQAFDKVKHCTLYSCK